MLNRIKIILLTSSILLIMLILVMQQDTTSASAKQDIAPSVAASPYSCQYGLTSLASDQNQWLDYFKAGWTLSFGVTPSGTTNLDAVNSTFTPMVRIKQSKNSAGVYLNSYYTIPSMDQIRQTARNYPGRLWFLGNEPDRVQVQDDIYPQMYAVGFHDVAKAIKEEDPTALIANAGLVQPTPGRLQYLDVMWDTYVSLYNEPMPVDVWNMHGYILSEIGQDGSIIAGRARVALGTDPKLAIFASDLTSKSCNLQSNPQLHTDNIYCNAEHDSQSILKQHIINMRTWMKNHGQQDKPLVINEYGSLFVYDDEGDNDPNTCFEKDENGNCFPPQRVANYMQASSAMFESFADEKLGYPADGYKMVQQWLWFSIYTDSTGQSSNLLKENYADYNVGNVAALTQVGVTFRNLATGKPLVPNLQPSKVQPVIAFRESGTATAMLKASILNTGNVDLSAPTNISFYSDSGLTQLIGTVNVNDLVRGCGLPNLETNISVPWELTTPGVHYFWVKVDSNNSIAETNELDNVIRGIVIIDPTNVYLPIVRR
jgi:hypothetical protein